MVRKNPFTKTTGCIIRLSIKKERDSCLPVCKPVRLDGEVKRHECVCSEKAAAVRNWVCYTMRLKCAVPLSNTYSRKDTTEFVNHKEHAGYQLNFLNFNHFTLHILLDYIKSHPYPV